MIEFKSSDVKFYSVFRNLPHLVQAIADAKEQGTFKAERVISSPQRARVSVEGSSSKVLNMCANNYLGYCDHPELIEAARKALDTHGVGLSSVRFICGTQDLHKELEAIISKFHHTDDTILYPSCFDANAGLFEAILTKEDAILSDALNHASIIDGVRLCKARRMRYEHNDMAALEAALIESRDARVRLIATDSVFSMDGDVAPLKEIVRLARKHDALVMIDECHATGVLGDSGIGATEACDVLGQVDIINSTLGKAMGGASGGFTTGRQDVVDVLRQKARPYLFSNTIAPPLVAAATKAFELLMADPAPLVQLKSNAALFRSRLEEAGFELKPGNTAIVPVMLHDAALATKMAALLLQKGVYVIGFSYPVVPMGAARIRAQVSAAHSEADINFAADMFIESGRELGVIS
eukprot:PRCOL_00004803-RA